MKNLFLVLSLFVAGCASAMPPLPPSLAGNGSFIFPNDARVEAVVVIKTNDEGTNGVWTQHGLYTGAPGELVKFTCDPLNKYYSAYSTNSSGARSVCVEPITNTVLEKPTLKK